jgi:hypothetical protein
MAGSVDRENLTSHHGRRLLSYGIAGSAAVAIAWAIAAWLFL